MFGNDRVEGGRSWVVVKSSEVNFYVNSHRILIDTNEGLNIKSKDCERKEIFNCRFIVQSLGHLNSS